MNAERLLALYDRIADAPDAISLLRRFVLDLAVRGKLVPQDPRDEPASELLKRIKSELGSKQRDVTAEFALFNLPKSWTWTCLGRLVGHSDAGWSPKTENHARKDDTWGVLKVSAVSWDKFRPWENKQLLPGTEPRPQAVVKRGDFLISRANTPELIARAVIVEDEPVNLLMSDKIVRLHLSQNCKHRFALIVNNYADFAREHYVRHASGVSPSMKNVSRDVILGLPFPLPPLAEQHRIVAKVDELMALCDRLEAARGAREATRDRLTAASLARLDAPDPATFRADARFALDALPALTARPDQIKPLRQTILNLAVRGKLVPQDPKDEPAPEFDAEIEAPFEIPNGWRWASLHSLGTLKGGGTPSKARDDYWNGPIPWVSPKDMKVDYLDQAQLGITTEAIADSAANIIEAGSVLFVVRGMILAHSFPVAISRVPLAINQDMKALVLKQPEMAEFLLRAFKGLKPEMLKRVQRSSHGTCRIEGTDYSEFLVPIPPLAEQHRIVAKVDALMVLCDRLEASLGSAEATRRRLLDSLLAEALRPDDGRQLEAAE